MAVHAGPSMNSDNTKMSTRDSKGIDSDSRVLSVGECIKNKATSIEHNQKKSVDLTNATNANLRRKSTTDLSIPRIRVQDFGTTAPLLRSVSEGVYKADEKGNKLERAGPLTESTRRYSVLISGGTLSKQAPYVDRVKPELVKNDISGSPPSKMDRLQHSDSVDQSRDAITVPAPGHGRHLRSRKELFAFQQDLLLPRYRKLAGISENVSGNASVNTSGQSIGGKGGPPDPEESNGTKKSGATQRTEEVFEKVRLIIQGPTKVKQIIKPTSGKRRQAMPIYLKSGLPCGYVDPSSKCDAWLDANDFNE
ncbi:uncharacterized protein [Diadema antillarum]|uniref:uncharacterized protein n=1 Tax=Diadema antillarum TaxID=105358 RepID=UPI003A85C1F4